MIYSNSKKVINEKTVPSPVNDYGYSKLYATNLCKLYRNKKKIFVSTGILFNHTSSFSKNIFITKKIVEAAVSIYLNKSKKLVIGNLKAVIDLGSAFDYVDAMIRIMNLRKPDDFIISTGKSVKISEFTDLVFSELGLNYKKYVDENSKDLILPNQKKIGSHNHLHKKTNWKPKFKLKQIVSEMVKSEIDLNL